MTDETRARFLAGIAAQVPAERVAEVHLFGAIRQGGQESGVAVIAVHREEPAPGDVELEQDVDVEPEVPAEHEIHAEPDGSVPVAVVNRAAGFGAYEVFNRNQLPFHFIWRMLGQGTYAVGIEPSTNRTSGRLPARESGELIILQPGETRTYDLEVGALAGNDAIEAFAERVGKAASRQDGKK
jgi:hypothetical protein